MPIRTRVAVIFSCNTSAFVIMLPPDDQGSEFRFKSSAHTRPGSRLHGRWRRPARAGRRRGVCLYRCNHIIHANPAAPQPVFYKNRASAHIFAPFCPAEKPRRGRMPREYSETFSSPAPAQSQPPQAAQSPSSGAGAAPPIFAPPSAGSMASATFSISAHSMRLRNSLQPYS